METVIVDIDGTISKIGPRLKYIQKEPKDWDSFYNDCFEDEPIKPICDLVDFLDERYRVVFLTGRRESVRNKTIRWINRNLLINRGYTLLMRPNKDRRCDTITKHEQLIKFMTEDCLVKEDIAFIIEDRNKMVKVWRALGFTVLQPAEGDF